MSVTVSYGHLACGLEIVSVAIHMASSCSIYLYNVLNSRFRLLSILGCTCGGQFSDWLRQVSAPFSVPGPHQNPFGPRGCWAKWRQLPEKGAWCLGKRHWGLKASIVQLPNALVCLDSLMSRCVNLLNLGTMYVDNGHKSSHSVRSLVLAVHFCLSCANSNCTCPHARGKEQMQQPFLW